MHKKANAAQPVKAKLLTKQQVADMLQMSVRSVYRKSVDGEIPPFIKIGHLIRWREDVLVAWIENNCEGVR